MPLPFATLALSADSKGTTQVLQKPCLALDKDEAASCASHAAGEHNPDIFNTSQSCATVSPHRHRCSIWSPHDIQFPCYLQLRSVCAAAYLISPFDRRWVAATARRLRSSATQRSEEASMSMGPSDCLAECSNMCGASPKRAGSTQKPRTSVSRRARHRTPVPKEIAIPLLLSDAANDDNISLEMDSAALSGTVDVGSRCSAAPMRLCFMSCGTDCVAVSRHRETCGGALRLAALPLLLAGNDRCPPHPPTLEAVVAQWRATRGGSQGYRGTAAMTRFATGGDNEEEHRPSQQEEVEGNGGVADCMQLNTPRSHGSSLSTPSGSPQCYSLRPSSTALLGDDAEEDDRDAVCVAHFANGVVPQPCSLCINVERMAVARFARSLSALSPSGVLPQRSFLAMRLCCSAAVWQRRRRVIHQQHRDINTDDEKPSYQDVSSPHVAVLLTSKTIQEQWDSTQLAMRTEEAAAAQRQAYVARHRCQVEEREHILGTPEGDALTVMRLATRARATSTISLAAWPALSCWYGMLGRSPSALRSDVRFSPLISVRGDANGGVKSQTQRIAFCEDVRRLAAPCWRCASWLPWDAWASAACRGSSVPQLHLPLLVHTSSAQIPYWLKSSALLPLRLMKGSLSSREAIEASMKWDAKTVAPDASLYAREDILHQVEELLQCSIHFSSSSCCLVHRTLQCTQDQPIREHLTPETVRTQAFAELRQDSCPLDWLSNIPALAQGREHTTRRGAPRDAPHRSCDRKRQRSARSLATAIAEREGKSHRVKGHPSVPQAKEAFLLKIDNNVDESGERTGGFDNTTAWQSCTSGAATLDSARSSRSFLSSQEEQHTALDVEDGAAAWLSASCPSSPYNPCPLVLGTDSWRVSSIPSSQERDNTISTERHQSLLDRLEKGMLAAQQQRHACTSRMLLACALSYSTSSPAALARARDLLACSLPRKTSAVCRTRLAEMESRCKALQSTIVVDDDSAAPAERSEGRGKAVQNNMADSLLLLRRFLLFPPRTFATQRGVSPRSPRQHESSDSQDELRNAADRVDATVDAQVSLPARDNGDSNSARHDPATKCQRLFRGLRQKTHMRHALLVDAVNVGAAVLIRLPNTPLPARRPPARGAVVGAPRVPVEGSDGPDATMYAVPHEKADATQMETARTFFMAHWPLFTLHNTAGHKLKESCRLTAVVPTKSSMFMSAALPVPSHEHKLAQRQRRHAAAHHFLCRFILTYESLASPQRGIPNAYEGVVRMCHSYRRELERDDVDELHRCAQSALAHAPVEECRRAFSTYIFAVVMQRLLSDEGGDDDARGSSSPLASQMGETAVLGVEVVSKNNSDNKRESAFKASGSFPSHHDVKPGQPPAALAPPGIECTARAYKKLVLDVLVDGMRRDGWLLFHTYWFEALASCAVPVACFGPSAPPATGNRVVRVVEREADEGCGAACTVTKDRWARVAACGLFDAARWELRWFADTDDDDEEEEDVLARKGEASSATSSVHPHAPLFSSDVDGQRGALTCGLSRRCDERDSELAVATSVQTTASDNTRDVSRSLPFSGESACCDNWCARMLKKRGGSGHESARAAIARAVAKSTRYLFFSIEPKRCGVEHGPVSDFGNSSRSNSISSCANGDGDEEGREITEAFSGLSCWRRGLRSRQALSTLQAGDDSAEESVSFSRRRKRMRHDDDDGGSDTDTSIALHAFLRTHAAQLLAGAFQRDGDPHPAQAPRQSNASAYSVSLSVDEMEREVQPLRRRRYTRHVFSLKEEHRFLLAQWDSWRKRREAARSFQWHADSFACGAAAGSEKAKGEGESLPSTPTASCGSSIKINNNHLPPSSAFFGEGGAQPQEEKEGALLQWRYSTHLQQLRTPVGPLWPSAASVQDSFLDPCRTDAAVHYTFLQYMLRDRRAALGETNCLN